jgi:cyclic pyranopterin monophosphate synthase
MSRDPLTHFDESGAARMVAIAAKPETPRMARARASVRMREETLARIEAGQVGKGDVLGVARLAAIGAAKSTAQLIPLCHPVRLTAVDVGFELVAALPGVAITVTVHAHDRTGPEMEAITAASTAALTIYDMCKAADRTMTIEKIVLLEKSGGNSGHFTRDAE